ncbi:MAG: porin [Candidatus Desulfacyla sp.]
MTLNKMVRFWCLMLAMIVAFATPVPAAEVSGSALQDEVKALKKMVLELQKRVRELEADRMKPGTEPAPTVQKTEPVPETTPVIQKAAPEPQKQAPSRPARQPRIKVGAKPPSKTGKRVAEAPAPLEIGGRQVRVGISGAIQADVIHDFNAVGLKPGGNVEREFITANIPVGGPARDITNRTGFSPNQSFLSGYAETDTPWGPFRVYADVNLFNSVTGTEFQIYKAYGQWGWLKAGLDYSIWLNQAAIPDTLDFEGPNAAPEVRFTQASLKIPLRPVSEKRDLFFTVGVEDAQGDMTLPGGGANITAVDQFPAVVGKLSYEPDWAHLELGGLYRRLKAEGAGYDHSVNGWGVILSGSIDTWKDDNFILGGLYGNALGAYIQDTAGLGLDAAPTSNMDSSLKAIPAFGLWAAYQHWWSRSLRSTATYGFVRLNSDFDLWAQTAGTGTYKQTHYVSANLIWSPCPPFDVGLEYLFGHRTVTDHTAVDGSTTGQNHRLQFTMRWNFDWKR